MQTEQYIVSIEQYHSPEWCGCAIKRFKLPRSFITGHYKLVVMMMVLLCVYIVSFPAEDWVFVVFCCTICCCAFCDADLWNWAATWQNQQNNCAPCEDSDQLGHPPSLIRVFAVRMKKAKVLRYPLSAKRRLWSDFMRIAKTMPRLIWVVAGRTCHFVGFVMRRLICYYKSKLFIMPPRNLDIITKR